MIRTTYENETELITAALELHNGSKPIELDPTYSLGKFYRGLTPPKLKFDIFPQTPDTIQASCNALPLEKESVESIMFDPPFVIGGNGGNKGIIRGRFSTFSTEKQLKALYESSLDEFWRILKKDGRLFFKCQDTVVCSHQVMSHVIIINKAVQLGFRIEDLFVLVRNRAITDPRWKKQEHARKTHCYYLVFYKDGRTAWTN